jgi:uncharacterized protein (DUF169 family)
MDYRGIAETLTNSLGLKQPPVAVCMAESAPAGVAAYAGHTPAGCVFWEQAANGAFTTTATDHALCSVGSYTHNLEMSKPEEQDLMDALKVFADLQYVTESDLKMIPVLESRPKYVVYAPLAQTPAAPDVVLLFVKASQILILSEATQQVEGGFPPALGRPACGIVPQAVNSGRAALSLGCCGARAYMDTLTEETALYAIPGAKLEEYAQRIASLAKANVVLNQFHTLRRKDVEAGASPSVQESLARLKG